MVPIFLPAVRSASVAAPLLALLLVLPRGAFAQTDDDEDVPEVTHTYALIDARVVQAPGRVLDRATVVVRDGLIVDVGPDAAVPFDAERIEADSLIVYAGFIDGLSNAGIPTPKETDDDEDRPDDPGNPPDAYAGIQPDRDARDLLDASDKRLEQLRSAGFTMAHVVPPGRMLPGTGAVILLAGDAPRDLVVRGDVSLFGQFETARGVYPGTDMAILATWRQLYREAQRRQRIETLYAQNPAGLERPAYDPVHYAFFPVLDGRMPVYFHTEDALDLHRVLALQQQLGFPLVLTGLAQSFDAVEALKQADVPLLLTLDLPEAPQKKAEADSTAASDTTRAMTPETPASFFKSDVRTRSYDDVDDEKTNLEARQALEREKYHATAATLHEAGLRFGFTTKDLTKPGDALKNARTMIASGLPEDVALAALTTYPAEILGLHASTGTVEPGKMANLVVTDGPLFAEDTKVRYVFVDGRRFEVEATKQGTGEATVDPVGTWSYVVESPDGAVEGTLTITGSPGNLDGTITADVMPEPATLESVTIAGNVLSFSFDTDEMGTITAEVTLTADTLDGILTGQAFGGVPITGTRTAGPEMR